MTSQIVSPADIKLPKADDFVSAFGCEHSIDADFYEKYDFQDDHGTTARLTFGHTDNSFGLSLWKDGVEFVKIYDEFLESASIDEDSQAIIITMNHGTANQRVKLTVWPKCMLSIEAMR